MDEQPGTDIPIHKSTLPEAKLLCDLESISNDLLITEQMIRKLVLGLEDPVLIQSLFSAALIAYRRCFTTGVRTALTYNDIADSNNNAGWLHNHLKDQADKLIAHSVNPFEHTQAGFLVKDDKVIGVATLSAKLVNFDDVVLKQWGRLVVEIREAILRPKIDAAKMALVKAGERLPIREITKEPLLEKDPFSPKAGEKRSP